MNTNISALNEKKRLNAKKIKEFETNFAQLLHFASKNGHVK